MNDETEFMERANDLATLSVEGGTGPFGCVITRRLASLQEVVVAEGHNQVTEQNDPTAHAEVVAIRRACQQLGTFDLSGCKLYSSCEPCPMCLSAIYWAHIHDVRYGATSEDAAQVGFDDAFIYDELEKRMVAKRSGEANDDEEEKEGSDLDTSVHMKRVRSYNETASFDKWLSTSDKVIY